MGKYRGCPCCGISSSAAEKAEARWSSVLRRWEETATRAKDARALTEIARLHMDRARTGIYDPDDPGALNHTEDRRHLRNTIACLEGALQADTTRDREKNK